MNKTNLLIALSIYSAVITSCLISYIISYNELTKEIEQKDEEIADLQWSNTCLKADTAYLRGKRCQIKQ